MTARDLLEILGAVLALVLFELGLLAVLWRIGTREADESSREDRL